MARFPLLSTGAVAQYGSSRGVDASTSVVRFVDGTEQRYRNLRRPVRRWVVRLDCVTGTEMAAVAAFFEEQQGRYGAFTFTDPWDGTEHPGCSFDADEMTMTVFDEARWATRLVIRSNDDA